VSIRTTYQSGSHVPERLRWWRSRASRLRPSFPGTARRGPPRQLPERPRANRKQTLTQEFHPEPCRSGAQRHPHAHFVGSPGDGIRNDAIDANHSEQQCERGEGKDGGPIELRPGKRVIQPLLHRLRAKHRNLRVYRLDRVANHGEAIFGAAIDAALPYPPPR